MVAGVGFRDNILPPPIFHFPVQWVGTGPGRDDMIQLF